MKKFVVILAVLLMVTLCLNEAQTASAAMRNLFNEFQRAVERQDLESIESLIKEGLTVQDAVQYTADKVQSKSSLSENEEEFYVSLIKILTKYKGNFKDAHLYNKQNGIILSQEIFKALLDGGANPDKDRYSNGYTLLFATLYGLGKQRIIKQDDTLLERLRMLVQHKASLIRDDNIEGTMNSLLDDFAVVLGQEKTRYDNDREAMSFFLKYRGLESTSYMTQDNLDSISAVMEVLHEGRASTSEAKSYLKKLREKHRNIPDALKYLDQVSDSMTSSRKSSSSSSSSSKSSSSGSSSSDDSSGCGPIAFIIVVALVFGSSKKKK